MNKIILIIGICWAGKISAQFTNGGFELWDTISMFGQPYIDPTGWATNNNNDHNGFANTPVTRGIDSTGFFARIESNYHGIDALLPGILMQKIPAENLAQITYSYQCAYIFQTGRCIVNILAENPDTLLYTTSYAVEDEDFQTAGIDILTEWTQAHDSIMIQFIAKGNLDMWDEEEDGHSVFFIDNVSASYISSAPHFQVNNEILVYPNPTFGYIQFLQLPSPDDILTIECLNQNGHIVYTGSMRNVTSDDPGGIDLSYLPDGLYFLRVTGTDGVWVEKVVIQR